MKTHTHDIPCIKPIRFVSPGFFFSSTSFSFYLNVYLDSFRYMRPNYIDCATKRTQPTNTQHVDKVNRIALCRWISVPFFVYQRIFPRVVKMCPCDFPIWFHAHQVKMCLSTEHINEGFLFMFCLTFALSVSTYPICHELPFFPVLHKIETPSLDFLPCSVSAIQC